MSPPFVGNNATVFAVVPFNPQVDAEKLKKSLKSSNEDAVINVVANRTNLQRQDIVKEYKMMYGKDLADEIKLHTSGNFQKLLLALIMPISEYYAYEIHGAVTGIGTNEGALIEILTTINNKEMRAVKESYSYLYHIEMEEDIRANTSGIFSRFLLTLLEGGRDESAKIDKSMVESDAKALLSAGGRLFGSDEKVYIDILCLRNIPHLRHVFQEYEKVSGHDIEKAIIHEFFGNFEEGLLATVQAVKNTPRFFANCIYHNISRILTNDRSLMRQFVTRAEKDLEEIKKELFKLHGKSLESMMQTDRSGSYKNLLIAIQL